MNHDGVITYRKKVYHIDISLLLELSYPIKNL